MIAEIKQDRLVVALIRQYAGGQAAPCCQEQEGIIIDSGGLSAVDHRFTTFNQQVDHIPVQDDPVLFCFTKGSKRSDEEMVLFTVLRRVQVLRKIDDLHSCKDHKKTFTG